MRLEFEPTVTTAPVAGHDAADGDNPSPSGSELLKKAIAAAQAGDRPEARSLLMAVVEADPRSESAWLWLASISEYPEELLVFLENILDINPENQRAAEWMSATKSLLAKTFIQRGVDAAESGQTDFAADCFNQALELDQSNAMAWLWMASLSDSPEGKLAYLEQALAVDPDNADARQQFDAIRSEITRAQFARAKAAAVTGNPADALAELAAVLEEAPDLEEAWIFKSHLDESFDEKIATLTKALEFHPDSAHISSSLRSLQAIVASTISSAEPAVETEPEPVAAPENNPAPEHQVCVQYLNIAPLVFEEEIVEELHPTQELELPPPVAAEAEIAFSGTVAFADDPQADEGAALSEVIFDAPIDQPAYEAPQGFIEQVESHDAPAEGSGPVAENSPDDANAFPRNIADEAAAQSSSDLPVIEFTPEELTVTDDSGFSAYMENKVENLFEPPPFENSAVHAADEPHAGSDDVDLPAVEAFFPEISAPEAELPIAELPTTGYETVIVPLVEPTEDAAPLTNGHIETIPTENVETAASCPFCMTVREPQEFKCSGCSAVLVLSDLELLFKNDGVDTDVIRRAVDKMESDRILRPLEIEELTMLGIGHINLRNFQHGYERLNEAVQLNPNEIVLASQVNALHIRIEEIRRHEEAQSIPTASKRILVVDDSPTIRKLISGKLEKSGHEVLVSADGVEAIEMLKTLTPDLILLDITMPRLDGYQVCKQIRANETTKDVPVVMISGKDGFFDKVRGRMAGSSGYITKPFGPETLMKAVETYLAADQPVPVSE